jgi:hypothetical protein
MTDLRTKPDTGTAHTPGPWSYDRDSGEVIFDDADVCPRIATVDLESASPEQAEADGCLIAAGPDMFEALRDVVTFAAFYKGKMEDTLGDEALAALGETALAAIAKAEGRS